MIKRLSTSVITEISDNNFVKSKENIEFSDGKMNISDSNIDLDYNFITPGQVITKEEDTTNIPQVKTENVEMECEQEDLLKKYWEEFTSDLP